jgi:hypothetical protein
MGKLTFDRIEGITAGSAFTVNAFASDKTVTAMVYFKSIGEPIKLTKFTPKISSVKVGGQNWLSTEIIKITYEMYAYYNNTWNSVSAIFPSASHQVSEKDGTVSSSVSISCTKAGGVVEYPATYSYAYKITVESTQNLVGCKVVMSGFELSADYTINYKTVTLKCSPENGGTVTGGGTYKYGTTATISATPNEGYAFEKWDGSNLANSNQTYSYTVFFDDVITAYFKVTKINKILADTSQSLGVQIDLVEAAEVIADTTKVYG